MFENARKARENKKLYESLQHQIRVGTNNYQKKIKRGFEHIDINNRGNLQKTSSLYDKYKAKDPLKYNSRDILYYFKDLAKECNIKFVSNVSLDKRYMRNIKQLKESYDTHEILDMYEFLFKSDQTYLKKEVLHPGILLTGWGNKIYDDSRLYKKGKFVNNPKLSKREYIGDKEECAINDWGDE